MLFQKKVDRAMNYSQESAARREGEHDLPWEGEERPLGDELEKGDLAAMLISALVVIVPVCLALLVLMCLVAGVPFL